MARTTIRELAEIVSLQKGRHRRPEDGVCAMELVAWMAGEKHSDHPRSVSPVIAAFSRSFNDALEPARRQRLALLGARMIGTRGTRELELARCEVLWEWMIATAVPEWLAAAQRLDLATAVFSDRAAALDTAIVALDVYGHVPVRPAADDRTNANVTGALAAAGITGACLAGMHAADGARGSRARRRWDAARVVARAAAWSVAELEPTAGDGGHARLWQTSDVLCESAFLLLDRLIGPPPPPSAQPASTHAAWSAVELDEVSCPVS
jgi:hypothetical protein